VVGIDGCGWDSCGFGVVGRRVISKGILHYAEGGEDKYWGKGFLVLV